jgi:hypothetical protein
MSRAETAESLVTAAFVVVRRARSSGCSNLITNLCIQEIAETRRIPGDAYSLATCRRIARERARLMGEEELLATEMWKR